MLPRPTADPVTARMKASRDDQCPCNDVRRPGCPLVIAISSTRCAKIGRIVTDIQIVNNKTAKERTIAENRKARHDFFIEENVEAGLVLEGWEVKSLREGRANLTESYAVVKDGEAFLLGAHIAPLTSASTHISPDPTRTRKLLLHRRELDRLIGSVERKGYTLVPLSLYWQRGKAKLNLGLAKGKKQHDKRAAEKDRDWQRQRSRILKNT